MLLIEMRTTKILITTKEFYFELINAGLIIKRKYFYK